MQNNKKKQIYAISHTGKMQGQRQVRMAEIVQEAVAEIIQRKLPYEIDCKKAIFSVTNVEMNPDLKVAHVYLIEVGREKQSENKSEKQSEAIKDIQKIAPLISKQLANKIKAKYTPKIVFHKDEGINKAQKIFKLLKQNSAKL